MALSPSPLFGLSPISLDNNLVSMKRYFPARAYLQRLHAVQEPVAASLWVSIQVENELGDQHTVNSHALLLQRKYPDSEETRQYLQWKQNE